MIISLRQCLILFRKYSFVAIIFCTIITFLISKLLIEWSSSRAGVKCFTTEINAPEATANSKKVSEKSQNRYVNDELISVKNSVANNNKSSDKEDSEPNYRVHTFYYQWFPTERDELPQWRHWGQNYQPNWKEDRRIYPSGTHLPPHDIASNFYPLLGCYNSQNPAIIDEHMKQIRSAGIGVVVIAWHPPLNSSDWDMDLLLDTALRNEIKVAMHVASYRDRNPINFRHHLHQWMSRYGTHPALYRLPRRQRGGGGKRRLPVFYIYDSYSTPAASWREIFSDSGAWNLSVRGTTADAIFLALLVDAQHRNEIRQAKFDGFYTYFASEGFTYGSTWQNWRALSRFARVNRLIFTPSVGPGYIDTQVRPWNTASTRHRRHGAYYEGAWQAALAAHVSFVSVTSFNEWHEGSQIEPAVPKSTESFTYLDYEPEGAYFYLRMTKKWSSMLHKNPSAAAVVPGQSQVAAAMATGAAPVQKKGVKDA